MSDGNSVMRGTAFYPSGNSPRTRDWSRQEPDPAKPQKSAQRKLADQWEAYEQNWKDRIAREEAEKLTAQRRRQEDERKRHQELQQREQIERDKKRRQTEFASADFQITAIFDQHGLSEGERSSIEDAITQRQLWATPMKAVEVAMILALELVAQRRQEEQ